MGMEYKNRELLLKLYKALVRPHLEYCERFWSYLRKDILASEAVQGRFTRSLPGREGFSDEGRLSRLGLSSLEFRGMRGDLIATYRILRGGSDRVDAERLLPLVGESGTRGNNLRVRGVVH